MRGRLLLSIALLVAGSERAAAAGELFWRSIDVVATLESAGSLRVDETQALVMSGDWNGGERIFRLEPGQRLRVLRIVRIDPESGSERVLERGDLGVVDQWNWTDSTTVRWRSRAPAAPPFDATLLVYRLELVYEQILRRDGENLYRLAHDFAFEERAGAIERFTVSFDATAEWEIVEPVSGAGRSADLERRTLRFEAGPLAPGVGFVLQAGLRYLGSGTPTLAAPSQLAGRLRGSAAAALLVASTLFATGWWRRDRALGRFLPLVESTRIDRAWLDERVFSLRPEVVGAAWDRSVGASEVAAILARLVAEGKISSRVDRAGWGPWRREVLHLALEVPKASFEDEEKRLISGLFPLGDEIDSERLRQHYRLSGFDPVAKIRAGLESRVKRLAGFAAGAPRPRKSPTVVLLAVGAALLLLGGLLAPQQGSSFLLLLVLVGGAIPGTIAAGAARRNVGLPVGALVVVGLSTTLSALLIALVTGRQGALLLTLFGATLLAVGFSRLMFQILATTESALALARRRELLSARRFFAGELLRDQPRLDDRWFPWLVALELAPALDRWARRFALASPGQHEIRGEIGGGSGGASAGPSGGVPSGGWSGGGGAFGGAGTSASFAAAVTTMAAGVPSPSSSGSSGGGGGGGSSSGGGGGGGW